MVYRQKTRRTAAHRSPGTAAHGTKVGGLTHPPFTPRKPCQPTTTNEEPSVDVFPAQRQLVATDERACAPLTDKKRILMKLDLRDRVQAVIYVYETGLNQPAQ